MDWLDPETICGKGVTVATLQEISDFEVQHIKAELVCLRIPSGQA